MSVPDFVTKGQPLDLSLSGARVALVEAMPHSANSHQRRLSIESTKSFGSEDNINGKKNTSLITNGRVHQNIKNVQKPSLLDNANKNCTYVFAANKEANQHGVQFRNVPNGIAPILHHHSVPHNNENLVHATSTDEVNIIRKALNLDRFKVISPPEMPLADSIHDPVSHSTCDNLQALNGISGLRNVFQSASCTKANIGESETKIQSSKPITPTSQRSLPSLSHPSRSSVLSPKDVCILRRNSSLLDEYASDARESSIVLQSRLSMKGEELNELIEETREKIAAIKIKKRKDRKKKKKRQGSRMGSHPSSNTYMGTGTSVPKATAMSSGKPSESSPLQAFCKPMAVLSLKPDKTRPKYNPAQSGAWAPSKPSPGTESVQGKHQVPKPPNSNQVLHSTSELRISPRKSMDNGAIRKSYMYAASKDFDNGAFQRIIKVFLSEKQSGMLKELGLEVPCAPPATPTPDLLQKYEYVPSMNDCRAQRAFRTRLEVMEKNERKKMEKVKEEKLKQEKINQREKERAHRKRQRLEIYALNKIMTEFENENFLEFCKMNGIQP